jgi:hypothetical protein
MLTLEPILGSQGQQMWSGIGRMYRVVGLPVGQMAQVGNVVGTSWQFRFGSYENLSAWTGEYATAEQALEHLSLALQDQP